MTGIRSAPSRSIARRRMTPVVVSSIEPRTLAAAAGEFAVKRADEVRAVVQGDRPAASPGRRGCGGSSCASPRPGWRTPGCRNRGRATRRRRPACSAGSRRRGRASRRRRPARGRGSPSRRSRAGTPPASSPSAASPGEPFPHDAQHRHVPVRPEDPPFPFAGERQVFDVVSLLSQMEYSFQLASTDLVKRTLIATPLFPVPPNEVRVRFRIERLRQHGHVPSVKPSPPASSASTMSVRSQVKLGSSRPKWPKRAVSL